MLGVKQLYGMCVMSKFPDFLQNMGQSGWGQANLL